MVTSEMFANMPERFVTIMLPEDLPNAIYARLVRGLQGVLHAAGLSSGSTIHPDAVITDVELNDEYDEAAQYDPWAG